MVLRKGGRNNITQESKELLLKDLCARVPYHPKGHVVNSCSGAQCDEWLTCATFPMFTNAINNCSLYLRPMSSMTEIEKIDFNEVQRYNVFYSTKGHYTETDWLNANHFDYRGLIGKRSCS